ncbi:MAG: hypothetical protein P4L84_10215 [Isosphaeraceae bacterium]|nr:hypothetical protein [Isosphaeraceae bacterium]
MSDTRHGVSIADQSFVRALRAWAETGDDALCERLRPDWLASLGELRGRAAEEPRQALETLRCEHAAQVRPDLARIHPSWCIRGLRAETRAVRRAAVAIASEPWRETLRQGLELSAEDPTAEFAPLPEALGWVAAFWPERLVGDVPERPDDPPVIRILTAVPLHSGVRMVRRLGLAKWAASRAALPTLRTREMRRFESLRDALAFPEDRFQDFADRDLAALRGDTRHPLARLGTLTLARLLSLADSYRVRWALQHVPYPAAKFVRSVMPPKPKVSAAWVEWETRILQVATDQLRDEGLWTCKPEDVA